MAYILTMKGKDLANWRKQHGLTQKKLALALGVDVMTISRWERDKSQPHFDKSALEALADALKWSYGQLGSAMNDLTT